ncbi:MAG: hypothetical protein HKP45_02630 [Winogradskyella sp.]|nr:hypothetical protein [Winogradskyella sp.]
MRFLLKISFLAVFVLHLSCETSEMANNSPEFKGVVDWAKTLGGSEEDFGFSIINTIDHNLAILGHTTSTDGDIIDKTNTDHDYWLTVVNTDGDILWTKTYGGSGDDRGQKLIQTSDGGFAMAGYSMSSDGDASNNEGFHDNWLVKTDSQGNLLWEQSFGYSGHDHAYTLIETADGGFFMAGFLDVTASGGEGNTNRSVSTNRHGVGEMWCHKLDAQGNVEWQRYFGGSSNDRAYGAVQANDGGYVVTGYTESTDFDITSSKGSYDYWVIKLTANGELVWSKNLGGEGIDQSRSITKIIDGNYIIAGNTFSTNGDINTNLGSSDYWIVKINDFGEIIWEKTLGGIDFDYATSIKPCSTGYLVSGYSRSQSGDLNINYGDNDYWIIKIDEQGKLLWQKNFGGSSIDLAYDIVEDNFQHIYVVGDTESTDYDVITNKGLKDMLVIKIK